MTKAVNACAVALVGADDNTRTAHAWAFVRSLSGFVPGALDGTLHAALLAVLETDAAHDVNVARVAATYIRRDQAGEPLDVESCEPLAVFENPLAHALLGAVKNVDLGLEHLITRARRALLLEHAGAAGTRHPALQSVFSWFGQGGSDASARMPLMTTFGLQAFTNNYVMTERADERYLLDRLEAVIQGAGPGVLESHGLTVLLYAMYRPLALLVDKNVSAPSPGSLVAPLFTITVSEPRHLEAREPQLIQVGKVVDEVSAEVSLPYPRWVGLAPEPEHQFTTFRSQFPLMPERARGSEPVRMLVAGCGTGSQAASLALQFPEAQVTATDVSRSALAYAQAQAERHGLENLRFIRNDLVSVGALDGEFDLVECVSALNHQNVPFAALEALLSVLKPRGLLRLGLYSEAGRALVNRGRDRVASQDREDTHRVRCEYRQRIIEGREPEALLELAKGPEFYDALLFRDLLFPGVEHQFTLPQIQAWLERCQLRFAGFELPSSDVEKDYRRRFPKDKRLVSLDSWHDFEQRRPDTFKRMYQFWCVRIA